MHSRFWIPGWRIRATPLSRFCYVDPEQIRARSNISQLEAPLRIADRGLIAPATCLVGRHQLDNRIVYWVAVGANDPTANGAIIIRGETLKSPTAMIDSQLFRIGIILLKI